jgi:ATP-dependent Clp protease ATP-binding subunit ClpC
MYNPSRGYKEEGLPKINVYLPDDLATAVRAADIPVSAICQKALADAVQTVQKSRKAIAALRDPRFDPDAHPQFAIRLANRMTPRLRQALALARDASNGTEHVSTPDLLIGILDEHGNMAVRLLQALGQDLDVLREAAQQLDADEPLPGTRPDQTAEPSVWSGLTLPSRIAIGAALEASIDLGHNYLGCEHLLLGLLEDPDSGAGQVLRGAGLDKAGVRRSITSAVAGFEQARQAGPVAQDQLMQRLDAIEHRLTTAGF